MNAKSRGLLGVIVTAVAIPQAVSAHGYVSNPPSRSLLCKQGTNLNCGVIQYEPQSLEAVSGFPNGGPADGKIASAGLAAFGPLDEQTSSRWGRQSLKSGPNTFTWTFTANHVTKNWRYYLTQPNWNPNQPLTRAAFELIPFCTVDGNMQRPPMTVSHTCNVPARSGYQLILAVWEVGDTVNSFYNIIDADFSGAEPGPLPSWELKGQIHPSTDLGKGDIVRTRVFDQQGERSDLATILQIEEDGSGQAAIWSYNLAARINQEQSLISAGQMASNGKVSPVPGTNQIYAKAASGIERVEVQIDMATSIVSPELRVTGLASAYAIVAGSVSLPFNIEVTAPLDVTATLYDANLSVVGLSTASLPAKGVTTLDLRVNPASAGSYQLVVVGKVPNSAEVVQKTYSLVFEAPQTGVAYDYIFPQNLNQYQAGSRVLQSRDGRVYECKPWPYSGYCKQWSAGSNQFEPGVGTAWTSAWTLR